MKSASAILIFLLSFYAALPAQTMIDRIVAVVGKEIITESELTERTTLFALQNRLDATKPELRRQMLDGMISEKLLLAQSILDSVVVSDDEVTQALDQQLDGIVRQLGSQQRVEQYYGMPLSRIRREFREDMRKQLLVQRLRQTREQTIQVTRRETEEFYESYKDSLPQVPEEFLVGNIFVLPKPDSAIEQKTRQTLRSILDSIRAGGDFADFARRYSQDGTAESGGDLGPAKRGTFVPEFEAAVFSLPEKGISDIVKTEFGLHLIFLEERRGESVHARHILLRIEKGAASDSAAVELLRSLRARILAGESFEELAKKYSDDEETKSLGGDMGTVNLEQLDVDFAGVLKTLQTGEISQPHRVSLKNSYGYQIVLAKKRVPAHTMTLETDYKRIEQIALYFKRSRKNAEWVEELKKNIYWEIRL
jgi:peptidyl-prolyl cis-trans isomerase SurA